jgi:O-antigen ligase
VTVFYFRAAHLFSDLRNIRRFAWLYAVPLAGVIVYSLTVFVRHGMTEEIAHVSMVPFYNEHTAYGAVIALFIPVMAAMATDRSAGRGARTAAGLMLSLLVVAIIYSYTRAAWVSLAVTAACWLVFLFRVHTGLVLAVAAAAAAYVVFSWTDIVIRLESNTERSSTDYREHLQSISNISTDASNVERVNRWLCALRMFNEKKLFGYGPGTYQFQYGVFQRNDEKTYISTNFGDVGSAHSEYLGPLSEQGLPGMLLFMGVCVAIAWQASRYIIRTGFGSGRLLAMGLLLGLTTYFAHGFLNYFLDTDKASVPFWGFAAALTALQVFHDKPPAGAPAGLPH